MCHIGYQPTLLPAEDVAALEESRAHVNMFNAPPSFGEDPMAGLLEVYAPNQEVLAAEPRSVILNSGCSLMGLALAEQAVPWDDVAGKPAVPPTAGEFKAVLNHTTGGILDGLPELVRKSCVIAGGSVCAALCGAKLQTDVDFFLHGLSDKEEAAKVIQVLADYMKRSSSDAEVVVVRTHMAVTICAGPQFPHVQVDPCTSLPCACVIENTQIQSCRPMSRLHWRLFTWAPAHTCPAFITTWKPCLSGFLCLLWVTPPA